MSKNDSNDKTTTKSDSTTDENHTGGSTKSQEGVPTTRSGNVARR